MVVHLDWEKRKNQILHYNQRSLKGGRIGEIGVSDTREKRIIPEKPIT